MQAAPSASSLLAGPEACGWTAEEALLLPSHSGSWGTGPFPALRRLLRAAVIQPGCSPLPRSAALTHGSPAWLLAAAHLQEPFPEPPRGGKQHVAGRGEGCLPASSGGRQARSHCCHGDGIVLAQPLVAASDVWRFPAELSSSWSADCPLQEHRVVLGLYAAWVLCGL